MITAFFDESGDDPRDKAYVLAGWAASDSVWQTFSAEWETILSANGIEYFKHNEARGSKKQFAGKSQAERDTLIERLVDNICRHQLLGIVCTFSHRLFQALLDGSKIPKRQLRKMAYGGYTSPYYYCFHLIVSQLLRYLVEEQKITERVNFVFDDRSDALAACIKLYDTIRPGMPSELQAVAGTAVPGNDRTSPPLQAADLLAGQITANIRAGEPESTLKALIACRKILKCHVEPADLSRFKATLDYANIRWKAIWSETT